MKSLVLGNREQGTVASLTKMMPNPLIPEVLNVKIWKIMTKLCIRSDDTKKDCLLTPFSIVNLI
jgi:hypothetical protein